MSDARQTLGAAGLGAGWMFYVDPDSGKRRRALLRDALVHMAHLCGEALNVTFCDLANRTYGALAELRSTFADGGVDDVVLVERVRSGLGFAVRHPHAIDVLARDGRVILSGSVLADEFDGLLQRVAAVRGVTGVESQLVVHQQAGSVPDLQGAVTRSRDLPDLMQARWSPTMRLLVGLGGGILALYAASRGDLVGAVGGSLGLGLLARGITNLGFRRLTGIGAGRRAVDIQKAINIAAPVEEVFRLWASYEVFPRFMSHVREVKAGRNDYSRWVVAGPGGLPVAWNAVVTRLVPNQVLAWKTVPGSAVQHAGVVRFTPTSVASTHVDVRLSYNPVLGALGHAAATLLGANPKRAMDEDLGRMKSLLEYGKTTAHGEQVTREALADRTSKLASLTARQEREPPPDERSEPAPAGALTSIGRGFAIPSQ